MKNLKIKKSFIAEGNCRIDAPFHLSDGVISLRLMKDCPYSTTVLIDESEELFKGNIHKRVYVDNEEFGYPFFTASDMFKSDLNSGKFISKKYSPYLAELKLKKDWIVITRSGTLGKVLYTNADFENKIGTDDLIRIKPAQNKIRAGFLFAYLKSKYGYALITQSGYGGVVKHIEPEHIKNLPIPIFPETKQQEIHQLIVDAADLRVEANRLLEKAQNLILDDLPRDVEVNHSNYGSKKLSDINKNYQKRIDSIAYVNKGIDFIHRMKSANVDFRNVKDFNIRVTRPGIFKRVYVSNECGLPYLKGAELMLQNPFNNCVFLSRTRTPFLSELKLKQNQILFTCAGTIGNTRLITAEFEEKEAIGSQDIIRIESDDDLITSQYLFAYLNIPLVKDYVQSLKYGSVIERVEPFHVESIPIYFPSVNLSKNVTELISKHGKFLYTSFKNEQKAIQLIETEIDSWHN